MLHSLADQGQGAGQVFIDGSPEEAEDVKAKFLTRAYGAWVNDTYWLLMPYKLLDPGVELQDLGTVTLDGHHYTKLGLSFGSVGLTPGDRYWAYVDQTSNLVTRWQYILENQDPDSAPTTWTWGNWQRHGQVLLSDTRTELSGDGAGRVLSLAPIQVLDTVDPSLFEAP